MLAFLGLVLAVFVALAAFVLSAAIVARRRAMRAHRAQATDVVDVSAPLDEKRVTHLPPPGLGPLGMMLAASIVIAACRSQPTPGDTPASTPTTWLDTADTVDHTLAWALPASDAIVAMLPIDAGAKVTVRTAITLAMRARESFSEGLVVYRQRGGDACAVHGAVGALTVALVGVARSLGDVGWGAAPELERALASLGGLGDELAGRCDLDAGFRSVGASTRAQLTTIRLNASARGVSLRPFPDIAPPDGGVR